MHSSFSETVKEKIVEGGASGAFFFFSKGEKFIAKSCSRQDLKVLKSNAEQYAQYMIRNTNSYLTKVFCTSQFYSRIKLSTFFHDSLHILIYYLRRMIYNIYIYIIYIGFWCLYSAYVRRRVQLYGDEQPVFALRGKRNHQRNV